MIVSRINGGLGNQMFQYAAGKSLALRHRTRLYLDVSAFENDHLRKFELNCFALDINKATQKELLYIRAKNGFSRLLRKSGFLNPSLHWYIEEGMAYNSNWEQIVNDTYIQGFWQSDKYFNSIEDVIRKDFVFRTASAGSNRFYIEKVSTHNSVAVHIRRGDYVSDTTTNSIHGVCGLDYYIQAMKYISSQLVDVQFYIFSDDLNWVKANLPSEGYRFYYVDHNKGNGMEDLRLMIHCRHFIIANSTFSWWGAWLSNYTGKIVIAPTKWFQSVYSNNDILPDSWIKM